jgi:hypothetical protein
MNAREKKTQVVTVIATSRMLASTAPSLEAFLERTEPFGSGRARVYPDEPLVSEVTSRPGITLKPMFQVSAGRVVGSACNGEKERDARLLHLSLLPVSWPVLWTSS